MFFYLSFLRPPPREAPPSGTITITPQVANDLRTEPYPNESDVYYTWLPVLENSPDAPVPAPKKLTTWRTTNTYKEIAVPLPEQTKVGQRWRLVLTTQKSGLDDFQQTRNIILGGEDVGSSPFAVVSMPIRIVEHGTISRNRQTQIQRNYRFLIGGELSSVPTILTIQEELSYDLDKKIWDSGVGLSSWLVDLRNGGLGVSNSSAIAVVHNAFLSPEKRKYIELGTGTGIASITLAALRASLADGREDFIIATDLPSAMPQLEDNIRLNRGFYNSIDLQPAILDWDEEQLPDLVVEHGGYDAIIMSDVSYNTSSFPALLRTLKLLIGLPSEHPPLLLIGYKKRDSSERQLWESMVNDLGVTFERLGIRKGTGGAHVSVFVGKVN